MRLSARNLPPAIGAFLIRPSTSTLLAGIGRPGRVPASVISLVRWRLVHPVVRRTRLTNGRSLLTLMELRPLVRSVVRRTRLTNGRSLLALVELRPLVRPVVRRTRLTNGRSLLTLVELRPLVRPVVRWTRPANRRPLFALVELGRLAHPLIRGSGPMRIALPEGSLLKIPGVGSIRWTVVVLMVRPVVRIPVDVPVMITG